MAAMNNAPIPAINPTAPGRSALPSVGTTRRNVAWALANNGGRHLVSFITFIALARLLTPESFGVVALASVIMLVGNVLLEQGLGEALVQAPQVERKHFDSVFWATLAASVFLTLACALAAPLLADLLGQPLLADLLPILALQWPLNALAVVPQAQLQRNLDFKPLTIRGLSAIGAGAILAVLLAVMGAGAWSLVAQQVGSALAGTVALWLCCDWRPRRHCRRSDLAQLHGFGRKVLAVGLLDLCKRKADDLLVGIFLGAASLGLYTVAYQALLILEQVISKGFDALALSSLSRLQDDRKALGAALRTTLRYAAAVSVPVFALAAFYAEPLVATAFGERWRGAAPVLQILAGAGAMHTIFHYNHAMFKAVGRPDISVRFAAIGAAVNLAAFAIAIPWGIAAVAWAYVIGEYLMIPLALRKVQELCGISPADYLRQLAPALYAGAAMLAIAHAVDARWPSAAGVLPLLGGGALSLIAYLAVLAMLAPDLHRGLRRSAEVGEREAA